ncbi:SemiSWEET transporter [Blastococcus deserti]|uniref:SemiSWEET transporter n=1 Tax=Blastococcus deserti TaxID=2259033 RepID=A0ABW4XGC3_9ACTN
MIAALGYLAAALSIALTWPQVWRSCRHGRTLGLSPTGSWLGVALNLCWLTFGVLTGDPAQILTNVVVGVGNTAILAALLVSQPRLRSREALLRTATGAAGLAALAAGSVVAVVVVGADPAVVAAALGSVISLVGAAAALPQPLSLLLNRSQDLSGLSPTRWHLGVGANASWTGYGWLTSNPAVWLSAGVGLCGALVVCAILRTVATGNRRSAVRPATGRPAEVRVLPSSARGVLAAAA